MRDRPILAAALSILVLAAPQAKSQSKSSANDDRDSTLVIILKDGQRKTYPMSEVARIEFATPASRASNAGQGRFLGKWKVGDGMGGVFTITLERDGVARKTLHSPNGTWEVVGGEAQITWQDGWRDAIRRVGDRYQKVAFSPGTTFNDRPNHTASAEAIDRGPL